tara:strand:+ start:100 stop:750 length:651 start_codon:yes stop_codon:yes gene_type:complete
MAFKFVHGWWLPFEDNHFDEYLSKSIEINGKKLYQPKHLSRCFHHIKKKNTAIDIGAHCGFWSFYLSLNFKKTYAFEPIDAFRECFSKNIISENVELMPFAIGESNRLISLDIDFKNTGATHISEKVNKKNKVEMKKLDEFDFENLDFIKIDVEGYESNVVIGAEETLKKHKPIIIIEQKDHSIRYGDSKFKALDLLKKFGAIIKEQVHSDFILSW